MTGSVGHAAIVGGGIAGLASAWGLIHAGFTVTIVDDAGPGASSPVAGGMLAPGSELDYGEDELYALATRSLAAWPEFARELEAAAGLGTGWRQCGTLQIAVDRDEFTLLERQAALLHQHGVPHRLLDARDTRRLEPALDSRICGGLSMPAEASIDPGSTLLALRTALTSLGARFVIGTASVVSAGGRATGLLVDGEELPADAVLLAAGYRSAATGGFTPERPPAVGVRAVKGEILVLRCQRPVERMIRAEVDGHPIYLVPQADDLLFVGASSWDGGVDLRRTVRAALDLLAGAVRLVPELREAEIVEHRVGLRPATADNAPLIGRSDTPGLFLATGHFRNGYLFAPETARLITQAVLTAPIPDQGVT